MASNRMTPVEAAKQLGLRPQQVYGFIKHHRIHTFNNPSGKTQLVDFDEVKAEAAKVKHHREKDPTTGKPVKREAGVSRGTLLSYHGEIKGAKKRHSHRVAVVDEVIKGEDSTLIYTKSDNGRVGIIYETERLADAISKGKCTIESPEGLLSVVMFHFVHNEKVELAASLDNWCQANGLEVPTLVEAKPGSEVATVVEMNSPTGTEDDTEYNTPE